MTESASKLVVRCSSCLKITGDHTELSEGKCMDCLVRPVTDRIIELERRRLSWARRGLVLNPSTIEAARRQLYKVIVAALKGDAKRAAAAWSEHYGKAIATATPAPKTLLVATDSRADELAAAAAG